MVACIRCGRVHPRFMNGKIKKTCHDGGRKTIHHHKFHTLHTGGMRPRHRLMRRGKGFWSTASEIAGTAAKLAPLLAFL